MRENKGQVIAKIEEGSIAEEIGLETGDVLLSIDGQTIIDRIDFEMLCAEEEITLEVLDKNSGQIESIVIEKEIDEGLGLDFETYLMSPDRRCANHCKFCFVDQLPKGMRSTLYFKDDDWRLSFLAGNFVTLSNVGERELERIINRRVSPLFISVQATEPTLRTELLGNPGAGRLMDQLRRLAEVGIRFHAQIVLCHGINDGEALDRTLNDLKSLGHSVLSIAVVPVGMTKFREGLESILPYDKSSAAAVIEQVQKWRNIFLHEQDRHLIGAADEFFVLSDIAVPDADYYEGYPQIENGVGMLRKFEDEFFDELSETDFDAPKLRNELLDTDYDVLSSKKKRYVLATGCSAKQLIERVARIISERSGVAIEVLPIKNSFFGESVTVAGLVTGQDLLAALKDRKDADACFIPDTMLRQGEDVFLDGMTLEQLKCGLHIPLHAIETGGADLLRALVDVTY